MDMSVVGRDNRMGRSVVVMATMMLARIVIVLHDIDAVMMMSLVRYKLVQPLTQQRNAGVSGQQYQAQESSVPLHGGCSACQD